MASSAGPTRRLILIVPILGLLYAAVSWFFARKLIGQNFPSDEQPDFAEFGLHEPERVTFTHDDKQFAGWYFANPAKSGYGAVMIHGFTGNKNQVLVATPLFWERGCDIFTFDLRGHGQSSPGKITYGVNDKGDALAAVDWLERRTGLTDDRVGLMGWSWGAATALQAAAVRPGVAFVVADASYSSLIDIARVQATQQYGNWARIFLPGALLFTARLGKFDPAAASPERAVEGLTTPVLLVHSITDEFTPYQHSEAIYAASDHRHTELELTNWDAPHAESYVANPAAYTAIVDRFLANHAPGFGNPRS
jgi:dipeptidyl aminopeptidase/acylaminoacyl peptidase